MRRGITLATVIFIALIGQAYAFSLSDLFMPVLRVIGVAPSADGIPPVIDSFSVVSAPSGQGSDFTVKLCVLTAPFSPLPSRAEFAIDSTSNVVKTTSFTPDYSQSITCHTYTLTAPSTPGDHTVYVRVADSDGDWSQWESEVFYVPGTEHDPKIVELDAPPSVGAGAPFTITVSVEDADGDLQSLHVRMDYYSKMYSISGGSVTKTIDMPGFVAGTYTLYVTVYDKAGHSTTESKTINVSIPEQHPPKIVSVSAPSKVTPNRPFTVSVRATDEDGDVRLIGISVGNYSDSKEVDGGDETATFTVPGLPEGIYTLTAFARDNSNLEDTKTATILVGSPTPPGVDVSVSVSPSKITVGESTSIKATASADKGMSSITIYVNGKAIGSKNCAIGTTFSEFCSYDINYSPDSPGTYTIRAVARDIYGNFAEDAATLTAEPSNYEPVASPSIEAFEIWQDDTKNLHIYLRASAGSGKLEGVTITGYRFNASGELVPTGFEYFVGATSKFCNGDYTECEWNIPHPLVPEVEGRMVFKALAEEWGGRESKVYTYPDSGYVVIVPSVRPEVYVSCPEEVNATADGTVAYDVNIGVSADWLSKYLVAELAGTVVTEDVSKIADLWLTDLDPADARDCNFSIRGESVTVPCYVMHVRGRASGTVTASAYARFYGYDPYVRAQCKTRVLLPDTPPVIDSFTVDQISALPQKYRLTVVAHDDGGDAGVCSAEFNVYAPDGHIVYSHYLSDGCYERFERSVDVSLCVPRGDYRAVVAVTDRGGHTVTAEREFAVTSDCVLNKPPVIDSATIIGTVYVNHPFDINVCAHDPDGTVRRVEYRIDNSAPRSVSFGINGCKTVTIPGVSTAGTHSITLTAIDNNSTRSDPYILSITVHTNSPPTATVIPTQTRVIPGATFTYRVCGKDSDGKVVLVAGKVGSGDWTYKEPGSDGCAWFQYRTPSEETDLAIYGKVKDNLGAWSDVATAIVHVRYSAPNVYVFVPAQVVVGSNVVVKVVAYDVDGDLAKAEMNVYDATGTLVAADSNTLSDKNATVYFHFTPPRSGTYRVVVRVSDSHGKATIKSATTKAAVINTPPVASVYVPNKVSPGRIFDFRVCGKDSDGRVIQLAAKVGAGGWQYKSPDSEGCAEFVTTAPSTPTRLTIYGKAKDDDGAWSKTVSATVEVNYSAPGIVRFDVPSRVYAGKEFNVVVSARDVDRDLDRVELVVKKGTTVIGSWVKRLPMDGGMAVFAVSVPEAGDYTATVTVYDKHGLSSSVSKGFSAVLPPNVPPVVDSVRVLGTVYVNHPFDINVCAHDPDGTVRRVEYRIDNSAPRSVSFGINGCKTVTIPGVSTAGTHSITLTAIDNNSTRSDPYILSITVHTNSPPTAHATLPAKVTPGKVFTVKVCGTDPDGRVVRAALRVNSAQWQYRETDSHGCAEFSVTAPSLETVLKISAKVEDDAGFWSEVITGYVQVAYSSPTIKVFSAPDTVQAGQEFTVKAYVYDPDGDLSRAVLKVNGQGYARKYSQTISGETANVRFTLSIPQHGEYTLSLTVYDAQHLSASKSVSVEVRGVANKPPVVDSATVIGTVYANHPFDINVCAHDPDGIVRWVHFRINDSTSSIISMRVNGCKVVTFSHAFVPTPGEYKMVFHAVDDKGAWSAPYTLEFNVLPAPRAPEVQLSGPATVELGSAVNVLVNAVDGDGDLKKVDVLLYRLRDGTKILETSTSKSVSGSKAEFNVSFVPKHIGRYVVKAVAYDSGGRTGEDEYALQVVDTVPPVLEVSGPAEVNVPGPLELTVHAVDNAGLREINAYVVYPGGDKREVLHKEGMGRDELTAYLRIPVPELGEYNVIVAAADVGGNVSRRSVSARAVDEIPPMVSISAPEEVNLGSGMRFTVTVSDNYRIRSITVAVDGNVIYENNHVDANRWAKEFVYYFPHASPHSITVVAADYTSNVGTRAHNVEVIPVPTPVVDNNVPLIDLNAWYDASSKSIRWSAHVTDPNLADVRVYVNGSEVQRCEVYNGVSDCTGAYSVANPGTYFVRVLAADSYGNDAVKSVRVNVEDQPPTLTVEAPDTVDVNTPVTISVFSEDDFGLAHVEVNGYGVYVDENISGTSYLREFNVVFPSEGNYTYSINVVDTGGNAVHKSIAIVAETNAVGEEKNEGNTVTHSYDLRLTGYSGLTARVLIQAIVDGNVADINCDDVVVNVQPTDSESKIGTYGVRSVVVDGHSACEVLITGAGKYIVRATWMDITKGTVVTVFAESVAAPESVVVAMILGLVALGLLGRFI